jgi:ribosomal protein S8E
LPEKVAAHLREDAERRQDQDVNLGVAPDPEQVHIHHRVAARIEREEVEAEIAVEQEHGERRREHRKDGDDHQARRERGPAEDWHAHQAHAGRPHLEDRRDEVDSRQQRANAGDLQRPKVVVDAYAGRELQFGERRIGHPAGLRELADHKRNIDEQHARGGQPEAHRVECRKGNVAHPELQRHDVVDQPDHQRHRDEEDHDRAVRRENLVVVLGRQIALRAARGNGLLRAHHDAVAEAAQQHDEPEDDVHDADALVVDRRKPLVPQIRPRPLQRDHAENTTDEQDHERHRAHDDRLVERDRAPGELAEKVHQCPLWDAVCVWAGLSAFMTEPAIPSNKPGVTAR